MNDLYNKLREASDRQTISGRFEVVEDDLKSALDEQKPDYKSSKAVNFVNLFLRNAIEDRIGDNNVQIQKNKTRFVKKEQIAMADMLIYDVTITASQDEVNKILDEELGALIYK